MTNCKLKHPLAKVVTIQIRTTNEKRQTKRTYVGCITR
ncbi:MAG: Unknown protein [uncultured Sulfurovum sp.]|uniref:Uncharacterized protein n=1 Tax=uncultured Sulfurovum sp. TaxID=269237 RepID=A0A6S6THQ5_9BACT|nr:MAG: Unknown protein [uncultured Sulfurovum sp.]